MVTLDLTCSTTAEKQLSEYQHIIRERTKLTFERLSISDIIKTRPNTYILCLPPNHWWNKRKHPLQLFCQTTEKQLAPTNRQVCIHNDWWAGIIWNKDEECYYTNGLLKRLHNHDKTDSEDSEKEQDDKAKEPTVDQQIRQAPIDPALHTSPLIATNNLPPTNSTTMSTQTVTAATISTSAFGPAPMAQQRIANAMQRA